MMEKQPESKAKTESLWFKMRPGGCACKICIDISAFKNKLLARFQGRKAAGGDVRLPPRQSWTDRFPLVDLGLHPPLDAASWTLRVDGEVERPTTWTWEQFRGLPRAEQVSDFHCATTWSKRDMRWGGVKLSAISTLVRPKPAARFLIVTCGDEPYATSLSLAAARGEDVMLASELDGIPLALEHGGPLRLVVPRLYAWKSAKFVRSLTFSEYDRPGFWESRGYPASGAIDWGR